eukprot:10291491-Alexandrium_andersonii.AAC.1
MALTLMRRPSTRLLGSLHEAMGPCMLADDLALRTGPDEAPLQHETLDFTVAGVEITLQYMSDVGS